MAGRALALSTPAPLLSPFKCHSSQNLALLKKLHGRITRSLPKLPGCFIHASIGMVDTKVTRSQLVSRSSWEVQKCPVCLWALKDQHTIYLTSS